MLKRIFVDSNNQKNYCQLVSDLGRPIHGPLVFSVLVQTWRLWSASGVSEASIDRRIRAVSKRLLDGTYFDCVKFRDRLSRRQLAIARDYFLMGLSLRRIATKYCCSYYSVREAIIEIRGILSKGFVVENHHIIDISKKVAPRSASGLI